MLYLWLYHWAFDGWRIYCDAGSTFLFAFLVSSGEMDGKAELRWLGTSRCDNEQTIALKKNALRANEGKSSELLPPGPRSRVGTKRTNQQTRDVTSILLGNGPCGQLFWDVSHRHLQHT